MQSLQCQAAGAGAHAQEHDGQVVAGVGRVAEAGLQRLHGVRRRKLAARQQRRHDLHQQHRVRERRVQHVHAQVDHLCGAPLMLPRLRRLCGTAGCLAQHLASR